MTFRKGLMKEDTKVPNVTIRPKETHASTLHNIFGKMNHMPSYLKQKKYWAMKLFNRNTLLE